MIVILHFLCVSHWSAKNNPVSITTICLLFRLPAMQKCCWRQQMEKVRRKGQKDWVWGGWGGWAGGGHVEKEQHRLFQRQLDLSFHSVSHPMPIHGASGCWEAGERHPPTQSRGLCCAAQKRRGRVSERQGGMEGGETRCEESNYEFSAWKVQVPLKVTATIGINCVAVSLPHLYD